MYLHEFLVTVQCCIRRFIVFAISTLLNGLHFSLSMLHLCIYLHLFDVAFLLLGIFEYSSEFLLSKHVGFFL